MLLRAWVEASQDGRFLFARIHVDARETRGNRTQVVGTSPMSREYVLYEAKPGFRIAEFVPRREEFWIFGDSGPAPDTLSPPDLAAGRGRWAGIRGTVARDQTMCRPDQLRSMPDLANPPCRATVHQIVKRWIAVGDTRGVDVGRTGVDVTFYPVIVRVKRTR
jgi:hypothetical protein